MNLRKQIILSAFLGTYVHAETCAENNLQQHCIFVSDTCPEACALAVASSLEAAGDVELPDPEALLADSLPEGMDLATLSSGDPTALLAATGIELPGGLDANALAGIASGDFSAVDLTALTGGLVPEGIDIGVIMAIAGGDMSAIAQLDIASLMAGFGVPLTFGGIDFGAIISGLLGSPPAYAGECDPEADDYTACREEEEITEAEQAAEDQAESDAAFQEAYEEPHVSTTGLECTMDGMVGMAQSAFELIILPLSLTKEVTALALASEPELAEALQLMWSGTLGSTQWVGYLLHLIYALGLDYNYSNDMCEAIGYVYYAVDGMSIMTNFAQPETEAEAADDTAECGGEGQEACAETTEECGGEGQEACAETTEEGTEGEATEEGTEGEATGEDAAE